MANIQFKLQFSYYLTVFYLCLGILAALALLFLAEPWYICLLLILLPWGYLYPYLRKQAWLNHPKAILKVRQLAAGEWLLVERGARELVARLCGDSVRTPYFMILNFKLVKSRQRRSVVVMPDSISTAAMQQLQFCLALVV